MVETEAANEELNKGLAIIRETLGDSSPEDPASTALFDVFKFYTVSASIAQEPTPSGALNEEDSFDTIASETLQLDRDKSRLRRIEVDIFRKESEIEGYQVALESISHGANLINAALRMKRSKSQALAQTALKLSELL